MRPLVPSSLIRGIFSPLIRFGAVALTLLIMPYTAIWRRFYLDPDIWWHIRVGDWIAHHHALPHYAIFSQYSDRPWVAYSWSFDLLVSGAYATLGLTGAPKLLLCIQILISLVFLLALRRIAGTFWRSWPIAILGILAADVNPLRPVTLTVAFFILELLLIFDAEQTGEDRLLFWLGPLFMIWANMHIQFVYGIAVIGLYVACRAVRLEKTQEQSENPSGKGYLKLIAIFGLAVLGACVGPNGWLPYKVAIGLASQPYVFKIVVEMLAMDFRSPLHYVELLLVMAACFLAGRLRPIDFFRPTLLALTAAVSFRSVRDMWFAAIAASFVIAEAVRAQSKEPESTHKEQRVRKLDSLMCTLAVAVAMAFSVGYGARHGMNAADMTDQIGSMYPVAATEFVSNSHLPGPIYNSMNWGGFLIFNLQDRPVSIDGRTNIYGDELLARSVATADGIRWQSDPVLARSNLVIVERHFALASDLAQDADYRLVYQDPIAMVFVKQRIQESIN